MRLQSHLNTNTETGPDSAAIIFIPKEVSSDITVPHSFLNYLKSPVR